MRGGAVMDNTSGRGQFAVVPEEVKRWSWAGFILTWIWGLFNGVYISLLALIPFVNIPVAIYLALKGNELTWRNRFWYDLDSFHKPQRKWTIAAWVVGVLVVSGIVGSGIEEYKEDKLESELANRAITILMKDESANEFMGRKYSIKTNLGMSAVIMSTGEEYTGYDFILESEKGMFHVRCELKNETEIENIKISKFQTNNMKDESITIPVD